MLVDEGLKKKNNEGLLIILLFRVEDSSMSMKKVRLDEKVLPVHMVNQCLLEESVE